MTDDFIFPHDHIAIDAESKMLAREASKVSAENDVRLNKLEDKVNTLSILNEALFRLLAIHINLDETALQSMIETVNTDRKVRLETKLVCSECSRRVPAGKEKCMYCGGKLLGSVNKSPFL